MKSSACSASSVTAKIDNHSNWKGRFQGQPDDAWMGSIADMADVLKSLTVLAKSKSLSFREKRMLDRAGGRSSSRKCPR